MLEYKVYNEKNQLVKINQKHIDEAFENVNEPLKVEIITAMGRTRKDIYLNRLYEALSYDNKKARHLAIKSILSLSNQQSVMVLKDRLKKIDKEENESEFYFMEAAIMLLEKGAEEVKKFFMDPKEDGYIKQELIYTYSSGYPFVEQDLVFIIDLLENYIGKSQKWIQKLSHDEFEDVIIKGLEAIWTIMEETTLLNDLDEISYKKLLDVCKQIFSLRIDTYAKEIIAIFARGLSVTRAYELLAPIINTARGEVKKELKATIKLLEKREK